MELSQNWFAEGLIDFEYKHYLLQAWLQKTRQKLKESKLYPAFRDLNFHYHNLLAFRRERQELLSAFPKSLKGVDLKKEQLEYEEKFPPASIDEEISGIVDFAIEKISPEWEYANGLHEFVEEALEIEPVGIQPLWKEEGFLLLNIKNQRSIRAYRYSRSILTNESFHYLHANYISTFSFGISQTLINIKRELIGTENVLPNPATWFVQARFSFPDTETIIPVISRMLEQHISK